MVDITIKLILPVICIILSCYIIPLLKQKKVYDSVVTAVYAAEQLFSQKGVGKEKFEYVTDYITQKFKINKDELKNMIESVVYMLNANM